MAAVSVKNGLLVSCENLTTEGIPKSLTKPKKRAAFAEVQNNIISLPVHQSALHPLKGTENKPVASPRAKHTFTRQPIIQVKDTKACKLRIAHSRRGIAAAKKPPKETKMQPNAGIKGNFVEPHMVISQVHVHGRKPTGVPKGKNQEKENVYSSSTDKSTKKEPTNPGSIKTDTSEGNKAFSSTLLKCVNVIDIDKDEQNNPMLLGIYVNDVYEYLRELELKFPISEQYLKNSPLTGRMRAILIDWLVEITTEVGLLLETLYLTVAIIDRYLEKSPQTKTSVLQLVGITALLIASKYEEIYIPSIKELVYISDGAFTGEQILKMEITIVKTLEYSIGRPLPIHFLRRYSKVESTSGIVHVMAKYVMELGILEYTLCHARPSHLAAAAIYISLFLLVRRENIWTSSLQYYSNYTETDILPVVKKLCEIIMNSNSSKLRVVIKKYSQPKNLQVSAIPIFESITQLHDKFVLN